MLTKWLLSYETLLAYHYPFLPAPSGGGGAVLILPQVVPFSQCSDVYKRYADMDGVDATFIKDYKVNDSVCVNVTLLQANDLVSWNIIAKDLNVPRPQKYPRSIKTCSCNLIHSDISL